MIITGWLEAHKNETLMIHKQEDDDIDDIHVKLENVVQTSYNAPHLDDYVSEHSIILEGQGIILTNGEEVTLPNDVYEIPYEGSIEFLEEDGGITISTNRAIYQIKSEQ